MFFIDTHTHLYHEDFDTDQPEVITRAIHAGVNKMLLPNIDAASYHPMIKLMQKHPEHFGVMTGLHPTSVDKNYRKTLQQLEHTIHDFDYCAIGEIGIDLYWDKTFKEEQVDALNIQLGWAKSMQLPVAIHSRSSFYDILPIIQQHQDGTLKGVFHCFSGNATEAQMILDLGFHLGIGGVLTFKNSSLPQAIQHVPLTSLLLETDSPYLAPTPYRGKRNESSYIPIIAQKLADIKEVSLDHVSKITTQNASNLFKLNVI